MCVNKVPKHGGFTKLINPFLQNPNLSLKAKGLLAQCKSFPEDWKFNTKGIAKYCKEGVTSVGNTLAELEKHGYAKRVKVRDDHGRFSDYSWEFADQPVFKPESGYPVTDYPLTENPRVEKPVMDNPLTENLTLIKKIYTKKIYTNREREERVCEEVDFSNEHKTPSPSDENYQPEETTPQLRSTPLRNANYSVDGKAVDDIIGYYKENYVPVFNRLKDRCGGEIRRDKILAAYAKSRDGKSYNNDEHLRCDVNLFIENFDDNKYETAKRSNSSRNAESKGNAYQTEAEYWSKRDRQQDTAKPRGIRAINGSND
ncbi:helix-turn-helix domain-containing protein [Limibacter armeniacum]|uniref:helix-turn-helix domain-containing protein n=1 Tax=Limibacter armeniacum TaxID=466084 RepID=UPI002FE5A60B